MKTILTICTLVLLLGTSQVCFSANSPAQQSNRPNILVIMSDEHNASVLGCYGNKIIRTPNLDGLATKGVLFENCYCASPLCVPSRLSFTAGKYISHVGAWNNNRKLPEETPSLPRILNAAGYDSFLCGKMHYDANCRYGFKEIGGNMNDSHMSGYGKRREPDDLKSEGQSERWDDFHTGEQSSPMKHDKAVTKGVLEFLQTRQATDKPFFLLAGYLTPHFPLTVPEEYWKHYKDKVPMPVIPEGFLDTLPRNYKHLRVGFRMDNVPPEIVKKGRELYFGLVEWTDNEVGKVLATLASSPFASNTVVIYTADHGENMGEHGLWWKNNVYNSAARVPLIVSWPQKWAGGQRRTGACSLLDLVQTVGEIGGAKVPSDWDGDSLVPWLNNPKSNWKDLAITEYYAHLIASGFVMIRTGDYKYVYHTPADAKHPAERELYNLAKDPGEFQNLATRPENKALVEKLHAALVKELGEEPDITERRCRADGEKGYGGKDEKAEKKEAKKRKGKGKNKADE